MTTIAETHPLQVLSCRRNGTLRAVRPSSTRSTQRQLTLLSALLTVPSKYHKTFHHNSIVHSSRNPVVSVMSYVPVGVNLTQAKAQRLMAGHSVRLGKDSAGGGLHVHMTRRQADKWARHSRAGKGMILRMSTAQIRHHKRGARAASANPIENVDTSTTNSGAVGAGISGRGVAKRKRTPKAPVAADALEPQTKQRKRSANHPIVTTFEKDPLPGEHYAIPQ